MPTRPGFYAEENKKECYLNYIEHIDDIRALHKDICDALNETPRANFELSKECKVKESTICGRINELKEAGLVMASEKLKHKNPDTGFNCTCWILTDKYYSLSGDIQKGLFK